MDIHPIRNDADHAEALKMIERYWDAADGTPEADALDVLAVLADAYENTRWPIAALDPIETIEAHIIATGRNRADLARVIGSRSRASEVMARKRPFTINMIRLLSSEWHLPADTLIAPYHLMKPKTSAQTKKAASRKPSKKKRSHRASRKRVAA